MGRFINIVLDDIQRATLESGYRNDQSHTFRQHCQMILLKAEGRKSKEIAAIFGCGEKSVNERASSLHTRRHRGFANQAGTRT